MKRTKLFFFLLLIAAPAAWASLEEADEAYAHRTADAGAQQALALYEKEVAVDSTTVTPLWKAARACHWIGDHASSKKEKIVAFEKGIAYGEKAVALEPKSVESHFWLGALYGSYGETKGVLKSLALVKPIRREMEAVVRLDDHYQGGAGYRVLGVVDYKVPGFAGGNSKRALEQLNKALVIDATNPFNHYYMAEYFSENGQKQKALEHLDTLRTLAVNSDVDEADLKSIQAKGEKLRAKLQK